MLNIRGSVAVAVKDLEIEAQPATQMQAKGINILKYAQRIYKLNNCDIANEHI